MLHKIFKANTHIITMRSLKAVIDRLYSRLGFNRPDSHGNDNPLTGTYSGYDVSTIEDVLESSKPAYMSASIGPNGAITTEQQPGEEYTARDANQVRSIPGVGEKIHENILTGQYIDRVYSRFIRSQEGKAYIRFLKKYGNGKRNPGELESILVGNYGDGMVAATLPGKAKANIIINADYIHQYADNATRHFGLAYDQALEVAIIHELNHYFKQTRHELRQQENKVEFNNDFSLVRFYMGLMKKDSANKELYLKKTELLRSRYGGDFRKKMDAYVEKHSEVMEKESYSGNRLSKLADILEGTLDNIISAVKGKEPEYATAYSF
jgi:hypothetical protein